ncbi:MAG: PDZ domain-containing protein [Gallionella sp.]
MRTRIGLMTLLMPIMASGAYGETATSSAQSGVILKAPTTAEKIAALPAGNFDAKLSAYLKNQLEWGKLHEADGDALLAAGNPQAALEAYYKGLGEVGAGGYWYGWKIEPALDGYKVIEVGAGTHAASAGVQVGDVLISADGTKLDGIQKDATDILFYMINNVPTRPQVFEVMRGTKTLEIKIDRRPSYKGPSNIPEENTFREALEQKTLRLIIDKKLEPKINDNQKRAAKELQDNLKAAKTADDIEFEGENVRGGTYASPGWADNYFNCGVLLEAASNATEAEKCYRNFLLMRPGDPQAGAVAARFANLATLVKGEENLKAWEGSWYITKYGQKTERGYIFERAGKLMKVKNHLQEIWMTITIDDEFNASALQTLTAKSMNGGPLEALIDKCFNGKIEAAGGLNLSPDKKTMTVTVKNDIDIDPASCKITRQNPSTYVYVR